jgi:hypothetical protein
VAIALREDPVASKVRTDGAWAAGDPGFLFPEGFSFSGVAGRRGPLEKKKALRKPFVLAGTASAMDKNDAARYGGYALIALGVLLYVVYGLIRGAPTDVGVYSITIVPVVFGIAIAWLTSEPVPGEN